MVTKNDEAKEDIAVRESKQRTYSDEQLQNPYYDFEQDKFDKITYFLELVEVTEEYVKNLIANINDEKDQHELSLNDSLFGNTTLLVYLGNIEMFLKWCGKDVELNEFVIMTLNKLMVLLPFLWLIPNDKFLHYTTTRLIFNIVILNVKLPGKEYLCEPMLNNVLYAMRGTKNNITTEKEEMNIDLNKANYDTLYSGLLLYHMILKHFRSIQYENKVYDNPRINNLLKNLYIDKNVKAIESGFKDILDSYPELEISILTYVIDLNKESKFIKGYSSLTKKLATKLINQDEWSIRQINRKRLELCYIIVRLKVVKFDMWETILVLLNRYAKKVVQVVTEESWSKYTNEAPSTFISPATNFDNDELYDSENMRIAILCGVTAIRVYVQTKVKNKSIVNSIQEKDITRLGQLIKDLIFIKKDASIFSVKKYFDRIYHLFIFSQPCLFTLITSLMVIDESIRKIMLDKFFIMDNQRELITTLSQLSNSDLLVLRHFNSEKFNSKVVVQSFKENDKQGVIFIKTFVQKLISESGWKQFIDYVKTNAKNLYYDTGILFMEATYELKKLYVQVSEEENINLNDTVWDNFKFLLPSLEELNQKFLLDEKLLKEEDKLSIAPKRKVQHDIKVLFTKMKRV